MNPVHLAFEALAKINEQVDAVALSSGENNSFPSIITADETVFDDYPKREIDASAGNITVTLKDASQMNEFTWTFHRTDQSSNQTFITSEDPTQLINGQAIWEIFPNESIQITSELTQFTVK